jgi:hypothetical protein
VARPARAAHPPRATARSSPQHNNGTSTSLESSQPHHPIIHVDVTFTLRRPLVWLLAGIAIGALGLPAGLLQKASLILQALLLAYRHN